MRRCCLLAHVIGVSLSFAHPLAAEEAKVRPGQTLGELLGSSAKPPAPLEPAGMKDGSGSTKLVAWSSGVIVCLAGLFTLKKVRRRMPRGTIGMEGIEILSRLPLSHKHAVYVVKACGRRCLVGVWAEGMTLLGVLDDADDADRLGPSPAEAPGPILRGAGGYSVRQEDRAAVSAASGSRLQGPTPDSHEQASRDSDLAPYRRQMDRIRHHLRSMRSEAAGSEAGDCETRGGPTQP